MKKTTKLFTIFLVCSFLVAIPPAVAQNNPAPNSEQRDADDDDDNGNWGLAGLLGLLGLLGLKKRDDDRDKRPNVNR